MHGTAYLVPTMDTVEPYGPGVCADAMVAQRCLEEQHWVLGISIPGGEGLSLYSFERAFTVHLAEIEAEDPQWEVAQRDDINGVAVVQSDRTSVSILVLACGPECVLEAISYSASANEMLAILKTVQTVSEAEFRTIPS